MERSRHTVCLHSHLKKSVVPGKELLGCIRDPHPRPPPEQLPHPRPHPSLCQVVCL